MGLIDVKCLIELENLTKDGHGFLYQVNPMAFCPVEGIGMMIGEDSGRGQFQVQYTMWRNEEQVLECDLQILTSQNAGYIEAMLELGWRLM